MSSASISNNTVTVSKPSSLRLDYGVHYTSIGHANTEKERQQQIQQAKKKLFKDKSYYFFHPHELIPDNIERIEDRGNTLYISQSYILLYLFRMSTYKIIYISRFPLTS
jgi:hypothetical protein